MEKCYTVAETVKLTGVKSYVLRYWEDELSLPIRRNELGHRCYTQDDIQLFLNIKELKNRGLQLRAIHDLLPKLTKKEGMEVIVPEEKDKIHLLESESIEKEENETRDTLREELLENVQNFKAEPDKKILEFQEILERLITQELHAKKEGEDRWRTLDAAIRRQQMSPPHSTMYPTPPLTESRRRISRLTSFAVTNGRSFPVRFTFNILGIVI